MSIQFINGTAPIYFDYTAPKPEPVHTQRSFFIYVGDHAFANYDEAMADASRIGLKEIVDEHGANLVIVNPASGSWETDTAEDASRMMAALIALLKEKGEGYVWYWQRDLITMVGNRRGADYISTYLAAAFPAATVMEGFFLKLMAQSVTLLHPTCAPGDTGRYIPEASGKLLPAFIAGGSAEAIEGYKKLNRVGAESEQKLGCTCYESTEKNATVAICDTVDADTLRRAYELVQSTYRRRNLGDEPLASVRRPNLSQIGVTKIEHNEYLDPQNPDMLYTWYEYLPDDIAEGERLPLMMVCHGGGENGQYIMEMTRWAFLVREERVICAAMTNHSIEKDSILLTHLLKTLPIDESRCYATGFSMGGVSSSGVGLVDSRFAGVAPQDGVTFSVERFAPEKMPIFYISGINDSPFPTVSREVPEGGSAPRLGNHAGNGLQGPPPPSDAQQAARKAPAAVRMRMPSPLTLNSVAEVLNCYFAKNGISFRYWSPLQFTEETGKFGVQLQNVFTVTDTIGGHVFTVGDLPSDDGEVLVRLAHISGLGHDVHPNTARLVWDFLKQFRRLPDGTLDCCNAR